MLYTASAGAGNFDDASLVVQMLPGGTRKIVHRGGYLGRYLSSGHLIYVNSATLFAVPFDLDRLETTGPPFPVTDGIAVSVGTGAVQLAVSDIGTIAYVAGTFNTNETPMNSPFLEQEPMFSPDGRWLAYFSTESGTANVFVRPFPGPGGQHQIGTGGFPMWSQTAKELLFINFGPPQIWSASYSTSEASFRADKPHLWSPRNFLQRPRIRALNLHPDGKRIAMAVVPDPQGPVKQDEVVFVFNFFDELKRLAPRK